MNYFSTGTISTRLQDVENALTSRVLLRTMEFLRMYTCRENLLQPEETRSHGPTRGHYVLYIYGNCGDR